MKQMLGSSPLASASLIERWDCFSSCSDSPLPHVGQCSSANAMKVLLP